MAELLYNLMKDVVMNSPLGTELGMVKELTVLVHFTSCQCGATWFHLLYLIPPYRS